MLFYIYCNKYRVFIVQFVDMVKYIDWIVNIELTLNFQDNLHLFIELLSFLYLTGLIFAEILLNCCIYFSSGILICSLFSCGFGFSVMLVSKIQRLRSIPPCLVFWKGIIECLIEFTSEATQHWNFLCEEVFNKNSNSLKI